MKNIAIVSKKSVNTVVGYAQGAPASVEGGLLTTPSNVLIPKDKLIEVPLPPHTVKFSLKQLLKGKKI